MAVRKAKPRRGGRGGEAEFLAAYDPSKFERPSVAVDVALISAFEGALYTLVLRRPEHPSRGKWALPGGFVRMKESLDAAAVRILADKTGLSSVWLEQLYTFGDPKRDPRTRVISVAYFALVDKLRFAAAHASGELSVVRMRVPWAGETGGRVDLEASLGGDAKKGALALAFDHADILGMAVKRVRGRLDYSPIGFQLLGDTFTLLELQRVHETVLGRLLNKDSFRRRMLATGDLEATGESQKDVVHRPAELYRFRKRSAV